MGLNELLVLSPLEYWRLSHKKCETVSISTSMLWKIYISNQKVTIFTEISSCSNILIKQESFFTSY